MSGPLLDQHFVAHVARQSVGRTITALRAEVLTMIADARRADARGLRSLAADLRAWADRLGRLADTLAPLASGPTAQNGARV